jgi:hypothetical protein
MLTWDAMTTNQLRLPAVVFASALAGVGCASEEASADDEVASDDGANNELNGDNSISVERMVAGAADDIFDEDPLGVVVAPRRMPKSVVGNNGSNLFAFGERFKFEGKVSYVVSLGVGRDCNGANACTLAWFSAREEALDGFEPNMTIGGRQVMFQDMSCGASCSPPSITFTSEGLVGGKRLFITLAVKGSKQDNVAVYRSAIRNVLVRGD